MRFIYREKQNISYTLRNGHLTESSAPAYPTPLDERSLQNVHAFCAANIPPHPDDRPG